MTQAATSRRLDEVAPVPLDEAQADVLTACPVLPVTWVAPADGLGLVLAEAVESPGDVPPFDNSAMDGFAVLGSDCPGPRTQLEIAGSIPAGHGSGAGIAPGTAVRIMTGAPVPPGAVGVCPVERTETASATVFIEGAVGVGDHVRRAGEDLHRGDTVVEAGTVLGPVHVGLLANVGVPTVAVHPRPRVGVLSTGDELIPGAEAPIGDSNRVMLLAALADQHFPTVDLGVVEDEPSAVIEALRRALDRCDAVVTSGGVSVGDRDVVRIALAEMETVTHRWMRIAIKPAKPFAFAILEGPSTLVPVFGLPGNPVAALVSFELLARPSLLRMAGRTELQRPRVRARAGVAFDRRSDGKIHLVTAVAGLCDGGLEAVPSGRHGPHRLSAVRDANALVVLPDGTGVPAGGWVDVLVLDADSVLGRRAPTPG